MQEGHEELCADALIFEPVPYRSAAADGCTHILALRTKPDGSQVTDTSVCVCVCCLHMYPYSKTATERCRLRLSLYMDIYIHVSCTSVG